MSRIAQPETYSNENSPWKHITTTCYKEMYFHLLESKKLVFANSYDLKYIPLLRISPVWLAGHSQGLSLYLVFLTNCPTNNISFVYLQSEITCRTYFGSKSLKISKRRGKKHFTLLSLTDMKKNWRTLVKVWVMDGTLKSVVVASKTSQSIPRTVLYKKTRIFREKYSKR